MLPSPRTAAALAVFTLAALGAAKSNSVAWGTLPDGKPVRLYTLQSGKVTLRVTDYGATIQSLVVPDKDGKPRDVVLGYNDLKGYQGEPGTYFGALVGRYSNRIAKGKFTLDGKTYHLPINNGENTLHGGLKAYDKRLWKVESLAKDAIVLSLLDPSGSEGFPGTVKATVRYTVFAGGIRVAYSATTDQATPISLTQHSYFDLDGEGSNSALNTVLKLDAHHFLPVDKGLIPTGQLMPVAGTPFDFLVPTPIGKRVTELYPQLDLAGGYDHTFAIDGPTGSFREAAVAWSPNTGIEMTVLTTEPGVQLYTANFLDSSQIGKSGRRYGYRGAFCLETQSFPDSPNHPAFPSSIIRPGKLWRSVTEYRFKTRS